MSVKPDSHPLCDHIFIDGMKILARIGTTDQERATPQAITIHARLFLSLAAAGGTDDINCTVDYARVAQEISTLAAEFTFSLVETLAEKMAATLLSHKGVESAWVRIEKCALPQTQCVGVEIWRQKPPLK